jgi:hypothetical protein
LNKDVDLPVTGVGRLVFLSAAKLNREEKREACFSTKVIFLSTTEKKKQMTG